MHTHKFKFISGLALSIVGLIAITGVASADTNNMVQVFTLAGNNSATMRDYTTPTGVTFSQTSGPSIGASLYKGLLTWKGSLNQPARFNASKDGNPIAHEAGRFITSGRVSDGGTRVNFVLGFGVLTVGKSSLLFCGQSFSIVDGFYHSYVVDYSRTVSTLQMDGVLLTTCLTDHTGTPAQFSIYGNGPGTGVGSGQFKDITLYSSGVGEPTPEPEVTPEPTQEPEPITTNPMILRLDKVDSDMVDLQALLNTMRDNNTSSTTGLLMDMAQMDTEARARDAAEEAARIAQDQVIEEEVGFLKGWLNKLQGVIDAIPFIGKNSQKQTSSTSNNFDPAAESMIIHESVTSIEVAPMQPSQQQGIPTFQTQEQAVEWLIAEVTRLHTNQQGLIENQNIIVQNLNNQEDLLERLRQHVNWLLEKWNNGTNGPDDDNIHNT